MKPRRSKAKLIILVALVLLPVWFAWRIVSLEWLLDVKLTQGVTIEQRPFKNFYDIHTSKGKVIENVAGWIVQSGYVYGQCRDRSYFLISPKDLYIDRFQTMHELNLVLTANKLSVYNMSDEVNASHIKYK